MDLQGSKTDTEKRLEIQNLHYRQMLADHLGVELSAENGGGNSLLAGMTKQDLRAAEHLCVYLESQEDGGQTLDEIFQDAQNLDALGRQIFKVADLMQELDGAEDFEGKAEARNMLANLSLQLKKTARIAAGRGTRIRHFT